MFQRAPGRRGAPVPVIGISAVLDDAGGFQRNTLTTKACDMDPEVMLELRTPAEVAAWVAAWTLACSLPAVGWLLFARSAGLGLRLGAVVIGVLGAIWIARSEGRYAPVLVVFAISLAWFWLIANVVYAVAKVPNVTPVAWFCGSAAVCVLFPRLLTSTESAVLIVPYGLEMMLSAYSYLVESREAPAATERQERRADALFFMLVNPALVRTSLGMGYRVGPAILSLAGVLRIGRGSIGLGASVIAARSYGFVEGHVVPLLGTHGAARSVISTSALIAATYFAAYWGHSGAVSVRIGWMQLLGWQVPERYHFPFLARSPMDFWRRWNLHWGAWLRRYVFDGLARHLRRTRRDWHRNLSMSLAVVVTFVASGILHDAARYTDTFDLSLGATMGFFVFALGLLAWEGVTSALRRRSGPRWTTLASACGGAVTLLLVYILNWSRLQPVLPAIVAQPLGLAALGF